MPDFASDKQAIKDTVGITGEVTGTTDTQTVTNKTINATDNTVTDTSSVIGDMLVFNGSKYVRVGPGATTIDFINLFCNTLRLRASDGSNMQFLSTGAAVSPNQHFHLFADYVKQVGATEVDFFYGFNSDFRSYKYYSKWSGSNKLYFQINPEFNYSAVWSNLYVGDNARIYFDETGLTTQNTYTFPDATSKLVSETVAATLTNKTMSGMTMTDATNIALGTTTGTKIGTATNQKLGFYNKTPVVQPSTIAAVTTGTVGTTYNSTVQGVINDLRTKLDLVITTLKNLGLVA